MSALGEGAPVPSRLARLRGAIAGHLPGWDDVAYALHGALCSLGVMWLAMWLELDAPYWAGSSVLIASQATRSQDLLKGFNFVAGTIVGTTAAVVMTALVPQGWWGYFAIHTTWVMLCTAASCVLKDKQSYGAALAGFTTLIIDVDTFAHPDRAFDVALSRGSAIVLGMTFFTLTMLLLFASNDAASLRATLRGWLDDGLGLAASLLRGEGGPEEVAGFLPKIADFDTILENGSTEAAWIGARKRLLRGAVLGLVDCVMEAAMRASGPPDPAAAAEIERLRPHRTPTLPRDAAGAPLWSVPADADPPVRDAWRARGGLGILRRDQAPLHANRIGRAVDYDFGAAGLGALRTGLAVGSAYMIWYLTRWPNGAGFLETTGIVSCMFAAQPSPVAVGSRFAVATVLTAVCALGIGFYVLPVLSGYRWLAAVLFPFLFVGALGVRTSYAGYFAPLNFFLLTMTGVNNVMDYNLLSFFDSVEALAAGSIYATVWFKLVPPPSKVWQARGLRRRLFRDAPRIAPDRPHADKARLRFAERLAALLSLVPDHERPRLVADALDAWRRARG